MYPPIHPSAWPQLHSNPLGYSPMHYTTSYPQPSSSDHVYGFQNTYQANYLTPPAPEPEAFRIALADRTQNTINATSTPGSAVPATTSRATKRKRAAAGNGSTSKRRNTAAEGPSTAAANSPTTSNPQPAVPGVGPQVARAVSSSDREDHPAFIRRLGPSSSHGSLVESDPLDDQTLAATDLWYFMRGLKAGSSPGSLPERETISEKRPDRKVFDRLVCRLCPPSLEPEGIWQNKEGQNATIRNHLRKRHWRAWRDLVVLKKLKGWEGLASPSMGLPDQPSGDAKQEPFSLAGFYERLVKWVAVDDQSVNVIDCPEFRDLLRFIGVDLQDSEIPHRTKLSELITANFRKEYTKMVNDIENSLGRVSFTSDIWSRQNLESYMAVTAHYSALTPDGHLIIKTQLVAFRQLEGSHTGVNIGKVFLRIIKEINTLNKLSMITLDNASNNNTMMDELAVELGKLGIPFDKEGNRIRCFPHVINIAVKAGLKQLTDLPIWDDPEVSPEEFIAIEATVLPPSDALKNNEEYRRVLEQDVVGAVRRFVTACRASGQRRAEFDLILKEGNEAGGWGDPKVILREVGLLKDVDTRWSSTFKMIDRFLYTYPVSKKLISQNSDLGHHSFDDMELKVLGDIQLFLYVFHVVQELVSAEKTPTLSVVLPMYERLIVMLKDLCKTLPELSHAIHASISKLEEYLAMSRTAKIYSVAMVLNPTIKFQWLKENWTAPEYNEARQAVFNVLLEYQKDHRKRTQTAQVLPTPVNSTQDTRTSDGASRTHSPFSRRMVQAGSASHAAHAQTSGFARLNSLARSISSWTSTSHVSPASGDGDPSPATEGVDPADLERRIDEDDRRIVEEEIRGYEAEGVMEEAEMERFDLLRFWKGKATRHHLFWRVALDVLPVQASAVPCERVFSSSKETDTNRRSNLEASTMEQLQLLKFRYRSERLAFTQGLICSDRELSVIDLDPAVVDELMASRRVEELTAYIDESWVGWGEERVS